MKNLGKKIFIIFSLLATTLYASVTARVNPSVVYSGDTATYVLTISGSNVKKPLLDNVCGNDITSTGAQTSIQMINSDYKKSYVLSYQFSPQKSCVIKPVTVEVDGKKEKSNEVKVTVKPPSQDKGANFLLSLKASKTKLYVGEPFTLNLELKQKKTAQVLDSKFIKPVFKGFWVKGQSKATREETSEYIITKASYKLAPQREGNLTIKPAQLKIATRAISHNMWGSFMPQVKWKTYYSNEVNTQAQTVPNSAKIVGTFTISAQPDKTVITPNEAVNVTVKVQGDGNLEDIGSFRPYIDGVNTFGEKIKIAGDTLTQKLAFVADKDFTVPSFSLAFYNLKTKRVEKIVTKPIPIKVQGATATPTKLTIQKGNEQKVEIKKAPLAPVSSRSFSIAWTLTAFVVGLIIGIGLMLLKSFKIFKKEKTFNPKDEKLLLVKLLPYKDIDEDVKKIVDILEANIYTNKSEIIDKKLLKEILKKYDIV